ncbi:hypothetical protein [Chitinilyticum aquatile]|uniref:hypothetical protein n=1 Tax=Chitinilyticum aquatile TaxID=362520 RepID=UPI0004074C33|nr:hypothetical protein [Chitinilyticum aquatile]
MDIAANAYCVLLVWRRAAHAEAGDWEQFDAVDHLQPRWGAVVLVSMLLAVMMEAWIGFHPLTA